MITKEEIAKIRELIAAATPPRVEHGVVKNKVIGEHENDFGDSLLLGERNQDGTVDLHGVYVGMSEMIVCHTGNGPRSAANAQLIEFAINNLGKLLDEMEVLIDIAQDM
jgi:hypothetical protein